MWVTHRRTRIKPDIMKSLNNKDPNTSSNSCVVLKFDQIFFINYKIPRTKELTVNNFVGLIWRLSEVKSSCDNQHPRPSRPVICHDRQSDHASFVMSRLRKQGPLIKHELKTRKNINWKKDHIFQHTSLQDLTLFWELNHCYLCIRGLIGGSDEKFRICVS